MGTVDPEVAVSARRTVSRSRPTLVTITLLLGGLTSSAGAQSADTATSVRWNLLAYGIMNRAVPLATARRSSPTTRQVDPLRLRDRMNPLVTLVAYLSATAADTDASKPSRRVAVATGP